MKGNLVGGVGYLVDGAKMLSHPRLRPFVLVPLVINILIFGSLLGFTLAWISDLMDRWLAGIPDWLDFVRWVLWPLVGLTLSLATGYAFTAVALLIASPFNGLLAEKAEELITGREVEALEGLGAALLMVPRGILRELRKLLYYLPMAVFVLVVSFVPVVNTVAPLLWFLLGAWMMSIQFVDFPMDNHQLPFAEVKEAVRSRRLSSMGFGGAVALCTGIPIVNFFVVPAAVVGATLLWCRELDPTRGAVSAPARR
ncbi:sulfate transporter CysZ [Mangrovimicrobium sediminis]|uniref:Sulfate transporter CysZ n=1 Tax=Mangrovimicrobium sediminis TaxID=2562682 RepID=A0A4Z0LWD0_9GAMM|nr:sulfate transporter CysZ [Haliea sp. SAOS-164]TGD71544.1 sulfate transporter CysZ [Haliea sp. SAOS-164]